MRFFYVDLLVCLIVLCAEGGALRLDVQGRRDFHDSRILRRRVTGTDLNNYADVSYYANLTLGGKLFHLLVDTGSSDLWVTGKVPNSKATPYTSEVNYAVGGVTGPVKTADLEFVGHVIPDQAFLEITPGANKEGEGIIGLGPNDGSNIYHEMQKSAGAAVLDRIFLQNRTTPNYLTVLLGRFADPTDFYSGILTVGEVLDGFNDILNQPKLPVTNVPAYIWGDQHFQLVLDEDGLIGPDEKPIPLHTEVIQTSNKKQATAVIDTGFSLPQIPKSAAAAIYSRFSGAELLNVPPIGVVWIVPCDREVNITFKFAGKRFPIHPLDTTMNPTAIGIPSIINSEGKVSCIGTFQPFSYDMGTAPNYDMVLGMAFMRNIYVLMDYGDFVIGSTEKDKPYMQFLSITDPAEAHSDFVKVRLHGADTMDHDGLASTGNDHRSAPRTVYYIVATVAVAIILAALGVLWSSRETERAGRSLTYIVHTWTIPIAQSKHARCAIVRPVALRPTTAILVS